MVADNVIRLLGRYSEGLRLTAEHGAHSGLVQEYVYQNQPHGYGPLGWLIDKTFLHLGTWDVMRQHVDATREVLETVVARRRALRLPITILDVAAGTAPYLRQLAQQHGGDDMLVVCHDRDPRQVTLGRQLVEQEGLQRFSFSVGDATDHASYWTSRDPDVVVAVDLFPWFQREEHVLTTMSLAFQHLTPGGCMVCSTLTRPRQGLGPWNSDAFGLRPTTRSPEQLTEWLRQTGFVKIEAKPAFCDGYVLIGWKGGQPGTNLKRDA